MANILNIFVCVNLKPFLNTVLLIYNINNSVKSIDLTPLLCIRLICGYCCIPIGFQFPLGMYAQYTRLFVSVVFIDSLFVYQHGLGLICLRLT